jgi:NADH dehydrogenase/NADH:ubiquinone oxidoreductase subunit G
LYIDGRKVEVPNGATLLAAARSLGIPIPTLCFQDGLPHHTSCMLCLVEDTGSGRLVPACASPAVQGQAASEYARRG